jgi:hypothetical protein
VIGSKLQFNSLFNSLTTGKNLGRVHPVFMRLSIDGFIHLIKPE